jgi:hypothetical protein
MNEDQNNITYLGNREVWGVTKPFGLRRVDRNQHLLALGKTGTGKTTMLRNLILHDVSAGEGLFVLDPHGDLSNDILDHLPPWRSRDLIYLNAADRDFPIAFNLLHGHNRDDAPLVASTIVGAVRHLWAESWGPRLEYFLYSAVAALAECQNTTLLGVHRLFSDERYREWVVKQVTDPAVKKFWIEFENYDKRFLTEALSPIENKIGRLLMSPISRNVLGQIPRALDPRTIMDRRQILLVNLAKGRIGEDQANLLGSLLLSQFEQAALSRSDMPLEDRAPFVLVVDEFQSFLTGSFNSLLSETRKYGLSITLSTQFLANVREEIRHAVLGNVGNLVSFRVGATDAQVLEREFGGTFPAEQFTDLPNHEVLVKLTTNGDYREPFHGKTFPAQGRFYGHRDKLIRSSRERYATSRAVAEEKLRRWMEGNTPV